MSKVGSFAKILFEIYKNFKLIFRNWASLLLIILAPLFLILLVGYSFSAEDLHGINIGIIPEGNIDLEDLKENVSYFADVIEYNNTEECIFDMALRETHICLEMKGNFTTEEGIPNGQITFYYDNTRNKVSLALMSEIKDYFGLTAEKISLVSTQKIIDNIQELLNFINERIDDIDDVKQESEQIKLDLIDRKQQLIEVRDKFTPRYLLVKSIHNEIKLTQRSLNESSQSLETSIAGLRIAINELIMLNVTDPSQTTELQNSLSEVETATSATLNKVNRITEPLDSVVAELDAINKLLNDEITRTDKYIELIDKSVEKIDKSSSDAKAKMKDLSKLDPTLAARIVRPITQSFEEMVSDVRNVQLAFPVFLTTVIVFVSLLFSNIITQLEINDKAYIRNILAPVNDLIYTTGLAVTNFVVVFFQISVLLLVGQISFGVDIISNLGSILPITIVMILIFVFIGMIIAYLSNNIQTSILVTTFIALGFFLFSDIINALEAMPRIASFIAYFNPVVIVNSMYVKILFSKVPFAKLWQFVILILYFMFAGNILIHVSRKKNKQRI